jgi:hypothetical protein
MALWDEQADNKSENNINKYVSLNNRNNKMGKIVKRLSNESIGLFAVDVYYICVDKMTSDNVDQILMEKNKNIYSNVHFIRMKIDGGSIEDSERIYARFGMEIESKTKFLIGIDVLDDILGRKPLSNDLIIHEPSNRIYKVTSVRDEYSENKFAGGNLYIYELSCVKYSKSESDEFRIQSIPMNELNNLNNTNDLTVQPTIDKDIEIDNIDKTEDDPFI